jgi:hypothetical protein
MHGVDRPVAEVRDLGNAITDPSRHGYAFLVELFGYDGVKVVKVYALWEAFSAEPSPQVTQDALDDNAIVDERELRGL